MNAPRRRFPLSCAALVAALLAILVQPAAAQLGTIFWVDGVSQLGRVNTDGSGFQVLISGLNQPVSVDVDPGNGHVYWAEHLPGKIRRANLDGSGVIDIDPQTYPANGLSIDHAAGKLYYTYFVQGPHTVFAGADRMNLNGTNVEVLTADYNICNAIEADTPDGKFYYGPAGSPALLTSVDKTTSASAPLAYAGACPGVTYGFESGNPKVFFSSGGGINSMDPNGANVTALPLPIPQPNILGLDAWGLNKQLLAWGTDLGNTGTIAISHTDGSGFQIVHVAGGVKYTDVAVVDFIPPLPEPASLALALPAIFCVSTLLRRHP